jgi:hypothetical protein
MPHRVDRRARGLGQESERLVVEGEELHHRGLADPNRPRGIKEALHQLVAALSPKRPSAHAGKVYALAGTRPGPPTSPARRPGVKPFASGCLEMVHRSPSKRLAAARALRTWWRRAKCRGLCIHPFFAAWANRWLEWSGPPPRPGPALCRTLGDALPRAPFAGSLKVMSAKATRRSALFSRAPLHRTAVQ